MEELWGVILIKTPNSVELRHFKRKYNSFRLEVFFKVFCVKECNDFDNISQQINDPERMCISFVFIINTVCNTKNMIVYIKIIKMVFINTDIS